MKMHPMTYPVLRRTLIACVAAFLAAPALAEMTAEELAKLAQNPVGNLISLPFQNNTNLNFGPDKGTQNILNIQPVIPISINDEWNIITRTIVPVIHMPSLGQGIDSKDGVGDTVFTAFLSPAKPGHWIWGAGPVVQIPTNSSEELGNKNWGLGPSFVVLHLGARRSLGLRRAGQQHLVRHQQQDRRRLQQRPHPAFRQLQLQGWVLPHERADPDRGLEGRQQPAVDRADRRRRGQNFSSRQAAGEHPTLRLLQRRAPRFPGQLAGPRTSSAHVSEIGEWTRPLIL
jgi:hypothetical protein